MNRDMASRRAIYSGMPYPTRRQVSSTTVQRTIEERGIYMLKDGFNGFCMALADSVPGVSGGTIAFIMGFYDRFIGAIHDLAFGKIAKKKEAVKYLAKLGTGWIIGMGAAVMVLSSLFESQIYTVSSLFIGFILGAIPLVIKEEAAALRRIGKNFIFLVIGVVVVAGITWLNGRGGGASMDLGLFSAGMAVKLFLIGMIAISAMFLPGISGSTLLLIFGAYIPVITAIKGVLSFDFSYIPGLLFFGCGVLAGAVTVVKAIRSCLEKYRPQTIYMILGMMLGSLYAIVMGPTTLEVPRDPLDISNFHFIAAAAGIFLVIGLQKTKEKSEH